MKKILMLILFLVMAIIPLYFIFIWSPSENIYNEYNKSSIEVSTKLSNIQEEKNDVNIDKKVPSNKKSHITIMSKISSNDRNIIEEAINKLSIIDILKVQDYMSKEDIDKGISDMLILTKKRLKENDFEKINKIINKYKNNAEI